MTEQNRGTEFMNLFPTAYYSTKSTSMNSVEFQVTNEDKVTFTCTSSHTGRPVLVTIEFGKNFAVVTAFDGTNGVRAAPVFAPVITLASVEMLVESISDLIENLFYRF